MNKVTTDIISTTGINISKYDIIPSKIYINGVEITDTESWNKAISKIDEKDKEIERLNNIINELEKWLNEGTIDVYFCSTSSQKTFKSNEIIIKAMILDKLKKLKECKE